ncbi:unnamed protein product [Medioppia subpectinata]|uniref:Nerve growth factor-related domain-containing protein n=1 Tax=Medioppia subpectinata TaxID=1979941 RepID=A0A7R9LK42_9ACAR|nr:unnamed protein product [Medioppia subpectinata]CAG2119189.1 unnamed protein product [Medioppia subpectinata]
MKLIIKGYLNKLLEANQLNESHLRKKLSSMSDYIASHPALHQRYLWVGPKPPPFDYDPDHYKLKEKDYSETDVRKRNSGETEKFPSEEICKTTRQWEQVNTTHDLYDNKVEVVQEEELQQFVFSYRCANLKGQCLGISALYHSECTERNGWMYMYYKKANDKAPQWGYVSAPHHCACKLQPKFIPTVATEEN